MKYSEKCLWKAIDVFCPNYSLARIAGVYMNLPECIKDAAEIAFIECETVEYKTSNKHHVASIIREALAEMRTVGWMTFGDQDEFVVSPLANSTYTVFGQDASEEKFSCCFNRDDNNRSTTNIVVARNLADELKDEYPLTQYWVEDQNGNIVYVVEIEKD